MFLSLFGSEAGMWDLIVLVPDHCLSFYFLLLPKFSIVIFFNLTKQNSGRNIILIKPFFRRKCNI